MKSILVIAPQSFPVTGTEAIVNIKLLRALSASGEFNIDLVSKKNKWSDYPSGTIETYGVKLNSIKIIEVDNKVNIKTIWQCFLSLLFFGHAFKGCHWAVAAKKYVSDLYKSNHYDYVLTKDSPSYLLGYYLKKKYGARWVATWNDPAPMVKYPFPYGMGLDNKDSISTKRTVNIMRESDIHIVPSKRLKNYIASYMNPKTDIIVIPHMVSRLNTKQDIYNESLRLIHSGNLDYPRNPDTFFKGLSLFCIKNPTARIHIDILGRTSEDLERKIQENNLRDIVNIIPSMEYEKSLAFLSNYNVAVIIEAIQLKEGIFMPTKVSDFMQCDIPIFAVSPEKGTLNDLYNSNNVPYFANVKSADDISKELETIYDDFINKKIKHNIVPESFMEKSIVETYLSL